MVQDSFRSQIAELLSDLPDKKLLYFAWLCGVRALPLLGVLDDFKYWKQSDGNDAKQKNLFSVLRALDSAVVGESSVASRDAYKASREAIPVLTAAYSAATAASAAETVSALTKGNHTVAINAAASAAYYEVYSFLASKLSCDIKSIIFQDLNEIRTGQYNYFNDTSIYGSIWVNFQHALQSLDNEYWFVWYERLFKKSFQLDDDDYNEVYTRLNIPNNSSNNSAAEVARHVLEFDKLGSEHFNEIRILILGEKGAGKTSLALRLKEPDHPMPTEDESTEGIDIIDWQFDVENDSSGARIIVHIWDFAGHVITHAVHRCFMSERCLYILVVNGRTEGDFRIEYWLDQIQNYGGDSPVIVLVNTKDNHRIDIQENTLKREYPSIINISHVNIGSGKEELEYFRKYVMQYLQNTPLWKHQKVSTPTFSVKEALRRRFVVDGCEYIQRDEFNNIAYDAGILSGEIDTLLEDLRDLGICLWYDDADMQEYSTMVLNPGWISHGIYRLINWGLNQRKHVLSHSDFTQIFTGKDSERYPEDKADFLFCLMRKYQLAFFKDEKRIFIPLLLPADQPNDDLLPSLEFGERLHMEYQADRALPEYTVSRLSVIHSDELVEEKSWRYGAVFRWKETDAIVEEHSVSRSISVSVKGPMQKEYISRLRDTLNGIFSEYKCNHPELKIEILIPDELRTQTDGQLIVTPDKSCFLQSEKQIIANASLGRKIYIGNKLIPWIDLERTMRDYGLVVFGDFVINKTTTVDISFTDCTIDLQGELNYIAKQFSSIGDEETAKELIEIADEVETIENEVPDNVEPSSQEMTKAVTSLRKKGLLGHLTHLYEELTNEDSDLYKKISKLKNGVRALQKLGKYYNSLAQWVGLPQIPTPLLGNSNND